MTYGSGGHSSLSQNGLEIFGGFGRTRIQGVRGGFPTVED